MKKHGPTLFILLMVSILFVIFGYIIDDDPAYPNFWHTAFEFMMLTTIVYGILTLVYWGVYLLRNLFRKAS